MILFLIAAQSAVLGPAVPGPALTGPATSLQARYEHCLDTITEDANKAIDEASAWRIGGGNFLARQCLGMAYAKIGRWTLAANEFGEAALAAEIAKDARAANYWAQSGNAWLAAGDPAKARSAIDAALASGTLDGLSLGETRLDRARVMVASGDLESARIDLDRALLLAKDDPLAWLLSATLARKMDDLRRAKADIAEALRRSADDAAVQLEAGNIAALAGEEEFAKAAWREAVRIAPAAPEGLAATKALQQFDEAPAKP